MPADPDVQHSDFANRLVDERDRYYGEKDKVRLLDRRPGKAEPGADEAKV